MVLYFSATGNCKYVATRLAKAFDEESVSIPECTGRNRYVFEDKTITIKHKAIETRKDNKRVILLKDKTKNQSSYRTLPLVDDIIVL